MGSFLDDDDDDWYPTSSRNNRKTNRKKNSTRFSFPDISFLSGLEWYDYIMIPLLCISAIMIVLNFTSVMEFFLILTVRLLDVAFVLLFLLLLILVVVLIIILSK